MTEVLGPVTCFCIWHVHTFTFLLITIAASILRASPSVSLASPFTEVL